MVGIEDNGQQIVGFVECPNYSTKEFNVTDEEIQPLIEQVIVVGVGCPIV